MQSLIQAWNAACKSTCAMPPKLLIPPGNFSAGEVVFVGPCTAPKPITIEVQGTLLGDTDLSLYTQNTWISFEHIDGLELKGSGTFNGQGEASWKYAGDGGSHSDGGHLPDVSLHICLLDGVCFQIQILDFNMQYKKTHSTLIIN